MNRLGLHSQKIPSSNDASGESDAGFSLVELLVAMIIFMLVAAAGFTLFSKQQNASSRQQGQAALNVGVRNAISMLQMDLVNAGSGLITGSSVPGFPVGVTFSHATGTCYNSAANPPTYGAGCFDTLNIITADPNTPPIHATNSVGVTTGATGSDTSTGSAYGLAASGLTLAQTAAKFANNDQILLVSSDGTKFTSVVLTAAPAASASAVVFSFARTTTSGTVTGVNANDPLSMAKQPINDKVNDTNTGATYTDQLNGTFSPTDWIIRLAPVTYSVDATTDANNPTLKRRQSGISNAVEEQVIGFRVGASIWNDATQNSFQSGANGQQYYYDPASFPAHTNDFSLVRSVRISLIARTAPSKDPSFTFRNQFDSGAYLIQGASVIVNPRNLSMND